MRKVKDSIPLIEDEEGLGRIVRGLRTVAVVGMQDESKALFPAFLIPQRVKAAGIRVIPVNPHVSELLGERCYPDLEAVPEAVDIVDIFRRSEFVPEIVEAAIRKGAKLIWMQEGVVHEDAARRAQAAGLAVVMDRCILKDHRRMAQV